MTYSSTVKLNIDFIQKCILEQNLKKTWIADNIGITKACFFDWLNGNVKKVKYHNAKALAKCLEVELEEVLAKKHLNIPDIVYEYSEYQRRKSAKNFILDFIDTYLENQSIKTVVTNKALSHNFDILNDLHSVNDILSTEPDKCILNLFFGNIHYLSNRFLDALYCFKKAQGHGECRGYIAFKIAHIQSLLGYFDEAKQIIKINIPEFRQNFSCCVLISEVLYNQGEYTKSTHLVDSYLSDFEPNDAPMSNQVHLILARNYLLTSNWVNFREHLNKTTYDNDDFLTNSEIVYLQAVDLLLMGKIDQSYEYCQKAKNFFYSCNFFHPALLVFIETLMANICLNRDNHRKCVEHLTDAGKVIEEVFKKKKHFLYFQIEKTRIQLDLKTNSSGKPFKENLFLIKKISFSSYFTSIIKHSIIYYLKGLYFQKIENFDEAINNYEHAVHLINHSNEPTYLYKYEIIANLADCYKQLKEYDIAKNLYLIFFSFGKSKSEDPVIYYNRYLTCYIDLISLQGDNLKALSLLKREYRKRIRSGLTYMEDLLIQYGKTWLRHNQPSIAFKFFDRFISKNKSPNEYYKHDIFYYLGICQLKSGQFDFAKKSFTKYLRYQKPIMETSIECQYKVNFLLGIISTARQEHMLAVEYLELALQKNDTTIHGKSVIYYFLGINYFLMENTINSQFYLNRFIETYGSSTHETKPKLLEKELDFSRFLLQNLLKQKSNIQIKTISLKKANISNYIEVELLH